MGSRENSCDSHALFKGVDEFLAVLFLFLGQCGCSSAQKSST